jgi:type IV pilus assembly protein PilO
MNPNVEWVLKRPLPQRIMMLVGLLVVICGLFVWTLILPQQEQLTSLASENAKIQQKLDADRRVAANLPLYKAEFEKMQKKLDLALTELPNGKEIPTLLTNISSNAKSNGLEVLTFKPGGEVSKGFYAEVPVSLKIEGSFHQLASFFYSVGTLSRIVNINNVKINLKRSTDKEQTGATQLSVDCLATTFRFLQEAEVKAAAAKAGGAKK